MCSCLKFGENRNLEHFSHPPYPPSSSFFATVIFSAASPRTSHAAQVRRPTPQSQATCQSRYCYCNFAARLPLCASGSAWDASSGQDGYWPQPQKSMNFCKSPGSHCRWCLGRGRELRLRYREGKVGSSWPCLTMPRQGQGRLRLRGANLCTLVPLIIAAAATGFFLLQFRPQHALQW